MIHHKINLALVIIGIVGFFASSFLMLYSNASSGFLIALFFMILFLEAYIIRIQDSHHRKSIHPKAPVIQYVPLSSNFMLTAIIGVVLSLVVIVPWTLPWGVAFTLVFGIMFVSSLISMTHAPIGDKQLEEIHMKELAIHERHKR